MHGLHNERNYFTEKPIDKKDIIANSTSTIKVDFCIT